MIGVSLSAVRDWINLYKSMGETGLITNSKNLHYSSSTKENAVSDYLNGKGLLRDICKKYRIRSNSQLRTWIKKYNGYEEIKTSGTGGIKIMTNGRKTTYEERIEIINYCIEN